MATNPTLARLRALLGEEAANEIGLPQVPARPAAVVPPPLPPPRPQMQSPRSVQPFDVSDIATPVEVRPTSTRPAGYLSPRAAREVAREQIPARSQATMDAFQAALEARRQAAPAAREADAAVAAAEARVPPRVPGMPVTTLDTAAEGEAQYARDVRAGLGPVQEPLPPPMSTSPETVARRARPRAVVEADAAYDAAMRAQAENLARAEGRSETPYTQKGWRNAYERAVAAALNTGTATIQGAGRVAGGIQDRLLSTLGLAGLAAGLPTEGMAAAGMPGQSAFDSNLLTDFGSFLERKVNEAFPGDRARAEDLSTQIASGFGSMVGFIALGMAGKVLRAGAVAPTAMTGAAVQGEAGYDDAVKYGADLYGRMFAFLGNAALGTTEAVPIGHFFDRLGRRVGSGRFADFVKTTAGQSLEETIQEAGTQFGSNVVAAAVYDAERDLGEGVLLNGAIGGLLGGVMGAGAGGIAIARGRRSTPPAPPPPPAAQGPAPPASPAAPGDEPPEEPASAVSREAPPSAERRPGQAPPSAQASDAAVLQAAGWSPEDIADMDPDEAASLAADARAEGFAPDFDVSDIATPVAPSPAAEPGRQIGDEVAGSSAERDRQIGDDVDAPVPPWVAANRDSAVESAGRLGLTETVRTMAAEGRTAAEISAATGGRLSPDDVRAVRDSLGIAAAGPAQGVAASGAVEAAPGTRAAPVRAQAAEDIDLAAGVVNTQPTDGQKEAGNYQKGHIQLHGFDVTIENPRDSIRSGVDSDGEPWQTRMPAHYGYIKRTTGADGDQVDVYVGPDVDSQRVFVVDQVDPATGEFDEHKAILGALSEEDALDIYRAGFSDGSGMSRGSAVTAMTVGQFRQWLRDGQPRRPMAEQAETLGLTTTDLRGAASQAPAPAASAEDKPVLMRPRPRPTGPRGDDILNFLGTKGLAPDPELTALGADKHFIPGIGRLVRAGGQQLDYAREAAAQEGYFGYPADRATATTTVADLLDLIDDALRGKEVRPVGAGAETRAPRFARKEAGAKEREEDAIAAAEQNLAFVREGLERWMAANDLDVADDEWVDLAARMIGSEYGIWEYGEALERASIVLAERLTSERLDQIARKTARRVKEIIPDEIWFAAPAPAPTLSEGGARPADDGGGNAARPRSGEGRADGEAVSAGGQDQGPAAAEGGGAGDVDQGAARPERISAASAAGRPAPGGAVEPGGPAPEQRPVRPPPDRTAAGLQEVIPGAEQASQKDQAQAAANKPLRPKGDQRPAGGMFSDDSNQTDLVEQAASLRLKDLRAYAETVVSKDIIAVTLVGSAARGAIDARDIDLLYDLGNGPISMAARRGISVEDAIEKILEGQDRLDLETYDSFFKVGGPPETGPDRYYHLSAGAGRAIVENTDYAKAQSGKPRILLATAKKEPSRDNEQGRPASEGDRGPSSDAGGVRGGGNRPSAAGGNVSSGAVDAAAPAEGAADAGLAAEAEGGDDPGLTPVDAVKRRLLDPQRRFANILVARRLLRARGFTGSDKEADEAIEEAVVLAARDIIDATAGIEDTYRALVALYERQPRLSQRTGKSMAEQAYSTPVPLAYLASRLARVGYADSVLEPTAGNGALLIEADNARGRFGAKRVHIAANELDDGRAAALRRQGFEVTQKDAATMPIQMRFDAVIANPPFGAVREGGQSKEWTVDDLTTTSVDHAIALNALKALKPNGRAVLIVGGVNATDRAERLKGYRTKSKREFFWHLHQKYRVTDIFTVDGDLYTRQGAGWPVDVIVIEGRGKSDRDLPGVEPPPIFTSWEALEGKLDGDAVGSIGKPAAGVAEPVGQPAGGNEDGRGPSVRGGSVPRPQRDRGDAAAGVRGASVPGDGNEGARQEPPVPIQAEGGGDGRGSDRAPAAGGLGVDDDALKAAFDEALDEAYGAAEPPARTKADIARSAAKNALESADSAMAALVEMFGGGKTVGSGLAFDPETYAKAKPLFAKAAEKFREFLGDAAELIRRMVGDMKASFGLTREAQQAMWPYLLQFVRDVQSGALAIAGQPKAERAAPPTIVTNASGQTTYVPASASKSVDTLIPSNMADAARAALAAVEEAHGPVDEFVADELGYTTAQLEAAFSAEQIDALALAISNAKRGSALVLGDQTGIGKGRVVAGMIRWARRQGAIPIFVTEKPDLYGDMLVRDMGDIGFKVDKSTVLVTDNGFDLPMDEEALDWVDEAAAAREAKSAIPPRRGEFLRGLSPKANDARMNEIAAAERPDVIVFTTYSQTNTVQGEDPGRRAFFAKIAPRSMLILDESHNAAGSPQTRRPKAGAPTPRSKFIRDLVKDARFVMYSSATYAKTPDVMDLYSRTDMAKAVQNPAQLPALIQRGGVPLQQIVASEMARAGQYIRRERSFDGVRYDMEAVPVDEAAYSSFTQALRAVFEFDLDIKEPRDEWAAEEIAKLGGGVGRDSGLGEIAASSTEFAAVMHNVIGQMILAIKADGVAQRAIAAIRAGEKPVVTVSNTMETFIDQYAQDNDIAIGAVMKGTFRDVMLRYLERTRRVTVKLPDGRKIHLTMPIEAMEPFLQARYQAAKDFIAEAEVGDLPLSPIDRIRSLIEAEGYTTSEITGRKSRIDYSGPEPKLVKRASREIGPTGKSATKRGFNDGAIDAIVINASGSTGISLHASPKVGKDLRPRHMIIAQPNANIDTHMQTLGRIHRTGQVALPIYTQLAADIPAEVRPASVLMKKMASLNANTTGARKSVFSADAVDFMNQYGDIVVRQVLAENFDWSRQMGDPIDLDEDARDPKPGDAVRRVTGRLTLLEPAQQRDFLDAVQANYMALIQRLDAAGENALEAKTLNLQARPVGAGKDVVPAKGSSPFEAAARFEKMSVVSPGRGMSPDEVVAEAARDIEGIDAAALTGSFGDRLKQVVAAAAPRHTAKIQASMEAFRAWQPNDLLRFKKAEAVQKRRAEHDAMADRFKATMGLLVPGARVSIEMDGATIPGVVLAAGRTGKSENPIAASTWFVTFAVPSSSRTLVAPFSQVFPVGYGTPGQGAFVVSPPGWADSADNLAKAFTKAKETGREERFILTGNVLAGFDATQGRGQIINFTMESGETRPGVLMPRTFDVDVFMAARPVRFATGRQALAFLKAVPSGEIESLDGMVTIRAEGRGTFAIETPAGRATGGRYFLEPTVRAAVNERFVKRGSRMIAAAMFEGQTEAAIDAMMALNAVFETRSDQEQAQAVIDANPAAPRPRGIEMASTAPSGIIASTAPGATGPKGWGAIEAAGPVPVDERKKIVDEVQEIVRLVAGMPVTVLNERITNANLASDYKEWLRQRGDALSATGMYRWAREMPLDSVIEVVAGTGTEAFTAAHESFHHVWFNLLTDIERRAVAEQLPALRSLLVQRGVRRGETIAAAPDYEVVADAFALYFLQRREANTGAGMPLVFRRTFHRLLMLIERLREYLRGRPSARLVFERTATGQISAQRLPMVPARSLTVGGAEFATTMPTAARSPLMQRANRIRGRTGTRFDDLRVKTQDRFIWWKRIQQQIERESGARLPVPIDVYMAETLYHGRAGERLEDLTTQHYEPLVQAMQAAGVTMDALDDFLTARHAPERNAEIRVIDPTNDAGSGMTDAEAAAHMATLTAEQRATMEELAARIDAVRDWTLRTLVRTGLLSRLEADEWRAKYPNYVPLRGWEAEETNDDFARVGFGMDIRGPESRQALGRRSRSDSPTAYIFLQAQQAIVRSEKNRVLQTLLRLAREHPDPTLWSVKRGEMRRVLDDRTGLVRNQFVPAGFIRDQENLFGVKIGGKTTYIEVNDKRLVSALRGFGKERHALIVAWFKLARLYAGLQTRWNPEFTLPNWMRDLQTALVNVLDTEGGAPRGTSRAIVKDAITLKAIRKVFRAIRNPQDAGEYTQWYNEYRLAGGKVSFMNLSDVSEIKAKFDRDINRGSVRGFLRSAVKLIDDMNEAVENSTRLTVYIHLRRNGFTQARAAAIAKDLTVNFNRKGDWSPALNSLYLFFNAATQGTFRMARAVATSGKVRAVVAGIVVLGMGLDWLNWFAGGDDDEGRSYWDAVPDYVKQRNIVLMLPWSDGAYVTIPLAYGYNFPFVAGQNIMATIRGAKSPLAASGATALAGMEAFNPLGVSPSMAQFIAPTFADPLVQVASNENWYGGRIYPEKYGSRKPDSENYFANVSPAAKLVAQVLNSWTGGNPGRSGFADVNPEVIEHYVEFVGGGAGRTLLNAGKTILGAWNGDEILPEDFPLVRRFFNSTTTSTSLRRDFYDAWDDVDAARFEVRELRRDGLHAEASEAAKRNARLIAIHGAMRGTFEALSDFRRQRDRINAAEMESAERRSRLDQVDAAERARVLRALQIYEDALRE